MPSYPHGLRGKAGKRRLLALLMQMRADGEIEHYGYRNEDRKPKDAIRVTGAQAAHSANG